MVAWSVGLITRYVKGQTGRTAYREARGHDAHAHGSRVWRGSCAWRPKNTSKSAPKVDAKFHDGIWLGLRMKSDGVIKVKTAKRLPEDQRWCTEEVLNIRGTPSNPVRGVGGDHIHTEVNGSRHAPTWRR